MGTSSMAMMPLGRVWDNQCECKVSRKSLDNSMWTIPLHITVYLVLFRLSIYTSQSPWWYSDYPITHQRFLVGIQTIPTHLGLPGVTQTIPILNKVCFVILRLSLYTSQSSRWYSDYPYTHHSLPGGTQTIPIHITVSLVVLRLSLYSTKSLLWYSDYSYAHHSLPGGT